MPPPSGEKLLGQPDPLTPVPHKLQDPADVNKEQIQIDTRPNPEACRERPSGLGVGRVGKLGLEQGVGKGGGGEGKCDAHTTRLALRNIRQIWRIR